MSSFLDKPDRLVGEKSLYCIGVHYKDLNRYSSAGDCKSMGNQIAEFARKNSRGLFKLNVKGFSDKVPYNGNKKNVSKAERFVMNKHKGANMYAIASIFTGPHAGRSNNVGVAHLPGTLVSVATHECFHILGLGHAGEYTIEKNGKIHLDHYGDKASVMSRYPSAFLTGPQYYSLGWLPREEVIIYDPETPKKIYTLKRLTDFDAPGTSMVIVPSKYFNPDIKFIVDDEDDNNDTDLDPQASISADVDVDASIDVDIDINVDADIGAEVDEGPMTYCINCDDELDDDEIHDIEETKTVTQKSTKTRDAYISFPPGSIQSAALHLSSGGASQKVKQFNDEFYDIYFTGLHMKILSFENNAITLTIDFDLPID